MDKIYKNEDGSLSMDGSTWEDTSVPEDSPERWKPCTNTYADYFKMRNEAVAQDKAMREGKDEKGEFYYIGEKEPKPEPSEAEKATSVRSKRDTLINETNWLIERHKEETELWHKTTLSDAEYVTLLSYRQSLRDVPEQSTFPESVVWPKKPNFVK